VVGGDAVVAAARPGMWDVVFVDPPYASDLAIRAVTAIPLEHLAATATIVIEHDRRHAPPEQLGSLVRTDERRYGDTLVSFYQRGPT
jgi:16S rRNA G966 N2-methylase RsmD